MVLTAERQAPLLLVLQFLDTEAVAELTILGLLQAAGRTQMEMGEASVDLALECQVMPVAAAVGLSEV
jgi:hypothetical protein